MSDIATQAISALEQARRRFGPLSVDYFGERSWRVWAQGWHIHLSAASHGGFAAHGDTAEAAAARLLALDAEFGAVRGFHCREECPHYDPCVF